MNTYINNVIVEEKPKTVALDDADVVTSAEATSTVYYNGYEVVHAVRITSIIRLTETYAKLFKIIQILFKIS